MNADTTVSIQDIRRDPLAFVQQLKSGKRVVVIYHSKPLVTVGSVETPPVVRSGAALVAAAQRARASVKQNTISPTADLKEIYYRDMANKYGIS